MDFTKPKDGTFTIAPQYLFDYLLKYLLDKQRKINPAYSPTLVPELEYDNYGRTDEEKFFLVANEKTCKPTTTEHLYECMKKYPTMSVRTNNVRDFLEYITGGFDIWPDERGTPPHLLGLRKTLESETHTFVMMFLRLQSESNKQIEGIGNIMFEVTLMKNMLARNEVIDAYRLTDLARNTAEKYFPRFISFSETDNIRDFRQWWTGKKEIAEAWTRKYNDTPDPSEKQELVKHFNSIWTIINETGMGDFDAATRILRRNADKVR